MALVRAARPPPQRGGPARDPLARHVQQPLPPADRRRRPSRCSRPPASRSWSPAEPLCCGRPLYDFGMLDRAKRLPRRRSSTRSRPEIEAARPIVGLEPSCVAVFRDELPNLFPDDEDARLLGSRASTLSEFLEPACDGLASRRPRDAKALVHGHCHHKAIMRLRRRAGLLEKLGSRSSSSTRAAAAWPASFGFEAGHYDVSVGRGERVLLPAVRRRDPRARCGRRLQLPQSDRTGWGPAGVRSMPRSCSRWRDASMAPRGHPGPYPELAAPGPPQPGTLRSAARAAAGISRHRGSSGRRRRSYLHTAPREDEPEPVECGSGRRHRRFGRRRARDRACLRQARRPHWLARARRARPRRHAQRGGRGRSADRRSSLPTDVADHAQVEAAAEAVERSRPDRRLGERRDGDRLRAVPRDRAGGVQAGDRGDVSGRRVWHDGRAASGCCRATAARSSRSARRSRTARSRSSPPTAEPSSRSAGSPTRCAPS